MAQSSSERDEDKIFSTITGNRAPTKETTACHFAKTQYFLNVTSFHYTRRQKERKKETILPPCHTIRVQVIYGQLNDVLASPDQWSTNFPKLFEPRENPRSHKDTQRTRKHEVPPYEIYAPLAKAAASYGK